MKTVIEMARESGYVKTVQGGAEISMASMDCLERFAELVRADERSRMCEQLKECSSEKSTSNEANSPAVLGEGKQAK